MSRYIRQFGLAFLCVSLLAFLAAAQTTTTTVTTDILGAHDLSGGSGGVRGANSNACIYCHAPHNALSTTPLWNQTLSTKQYTLYLDPKSATTVSTASMLCLSCHDGTVAIGQSKSFGKIDVVGTINSMGGVRLEGSHPFSIQPQLQDDASLVSTLVSSHKTKDATVNLIDNNVECSTCHDVHNQYKDRRSPKFLVRDNANSQLCMACHDIGARTVNGADNTLTLWPNSSHAVSTVQVAPKAGLGGYSTIAEFACQTCHVSHNAISTGLLRTNINRPAGVDDSAEACFTCHDGSDNLTQPIQNVLNDYRKAGSISHPFSDTNNPHTVSEPTVLDRNRHATCADCHSGHGAQPTTTFTTTSAIRPSQMGARGVTPTGTALQLAANQFETCLRCHGKSINKTAPASFGYLPARGQFAGDQLDLSLQFANGALSTHPVMSDAKNLARPSLLKDMWDLNFKVTTRPVGNRVLCTDCHNSDTNREFGGTGPNGPHGSKNDHILERQYVISKVTTGAGSTIVNLNPNPVLAASTASPYALCAKCHDLTQLFNASSWPEHARHVQTDGFSCSVCHSAHGVQQGTAGVVGRSLVNFDTNVVAPVNGVISWNGNSCTLTCHGHTH